ncbi:MAG: helix-turn-helix transcriptional regulator [Anaerolineae bacterium]|nr:helix-turn-helix transcriptional regulator [Anaerolineae bacterium]MCA9889130.1 helix-turn-helix transcriptional regulator [Anaerolineae bacterium]
MVTDFQIEDTHLRRIERVQDYILRHIQEPLDREILAEVAEYSVPHFHRVFTACTGESAVTYVRRLRLSRAGQKLRMGAIDIMEIALAAGYESHAAFSKAFKKQYGISPSDFRQLNCHEASSLLRKGSSNENHSDEYSR